MMLATSTTSDSGRATKLSRFFNAVLRGDLPLRTSQNAVTFIEALCDQPDPPTTIEKIISSTAGLSSLRACLRLNASTAFQNGSATALLQYIQSPDLKIILGGDYLHRVIIHIVDPPIFWNTFLSSFRVGQLSADAQQCFGCLLHELMCLPSENVNSYLTIAQDSTTQQVLLESSSFKIRAIGQKTKHAVSTFHSLNDFTIGSGPGGRHDNDFVDFREIAIYPTADEIICQEQPYLRTAAMVEDPTNQDKRIGTHLDNQFRLLREDMMAEMRDELQIIFGKKKGRHRGVIVDGLRLYSVDCGESKKRPVWGLRLQCTSDLRQLKGVEPKKCQSFLNENKNIVKHQSLACLITDGEIVAFPTIHRDVEQLAQRAPIIILQFTGRASTFKTLLRLKTAKDVRFVQIDAAVFAYEPVLRGLQEL